MWEGGVCFKKGSMNENEEANVWVLFISGYSYRLKKLDNPPATFKHERKET